MPEPTDSDSPKGIEVLFYLGTSAFFALVLVVTVGLSIYGHQSSADSRDVRLGAQDESSEEAGVDEGARIFGLRCASCHGSEGEGGVGPSFVGVTDRIPDVADHEAVVRGGRNAMPGFEGVLSDEQIELVVRFERETLDVG